MFSQLQLSSLQISVPTALTSALDTRTSQDARPLDPRAASRRWDTDKPVEDSPDWLAGRGTRKPFAYYFGDDDKGRKNRAMLANIKCLHHKSRNRQQTNVGICANYVAGGRCADPACKLAHFLVRHATRAASGNSGKGEKLCQQIEAAFASIYS